MSLTDKEHHILRHALGLNRADVSYRNYFCTGPGSDNYPVCCALVERGYRTPSSA